MAFKALTGIGAPCPYTGAGLIVGRVGRAYMIVMDSRVGRYRSCLLPDLDSVHAFIRSSPPGSAPEVPAKEPLLTCAYSGKPLSIRELAGGMWVATSSWGDGLGYVTNLFDTREKLVYFLSFRDGIAPAFAPGPAIEVRERVPPAGPTEDSVQARNMSEELHEEATEFVERTVVDGAPARRGRGRPRKS